MERPTAKTMDCFVEFRTPESCDSFAGVIEREQGEGRFPKLGNRHVYVERCTIDALMKEMWPRAKCIVWTDGCPHKSDNVDPFSTGFQGFFTTEEMVGLTRAAETPQRVGHDLNTWNGRDADKGSLRSAKNAFSEPTSV